MLCDKCKKNVATFHLKTVVNGVSKEEHLCSECAKENNKYFGNFVHDMFNFENEFNSLSAFNPFSEFENLFGGYLPNCECGTSFEDIIRSGNVGCDNCYANYRNLLNDAVKSINIGASKSIDEMNNSNHEEIVKLRKMLERAVEDEDYELASKLKKQIDELSSKK